jgi:hypothetical protein
MSGKEAHRHLMKASTLHLVGAFLWVAAAVPITAFPWLRNSVYLVLLISLYANIVGHWSAYEASKAKEEVEPTEGGQT